RWRAGPPRCGRRDPGYAAGHLPHPASRPSPDGPRAAKRKKRKKPACKKKEQPQQRSRKKPFTQVAPQIAPVDEPRRAHELGLFAPLVARFPSQWFLVLLSVLSGVLWFLACA